MYHLLSSLPPEKSCSSAGQAAAPYGRSKPRSPHPGDQLANVMSNDDTDSLFMDPSWKDPALGGLGPRGGAGPGGFPQLTQGASSSMQSSAAGDPFSQLSLSRGPSGTLLHPFGTVYQAESLSSASHHRNVQLARCPSTGQLTTVIALLLMHRG